MFMRIDRRFMAKCFGQMQELGIYPGQIPVLGLLAYKDGLSQREIAEKLHIKLREKNQQTVQTIDNHSECPDSPKGVVLSGRLDTSLARTIFAKAIEAGYIEEVGSHYSWKGTKALLAYMCGRIYCGDYPEYSKYEQKIFWEFGNGLFPDVELNALFEQTGIGQSRQNRRDMPVPNNAGEIDKFFQK